MAIRLRYVEGKKVALCAAHAKAKPGDIYIDDGWDHALRAKFCKDYTSEGIPGLALDPELDALMDAEEVHDAQEG